MRETKRKETKNMKIALFIIFIAIVWGGNHISKQLSQIIHLLKQTKKKINNENFNMEYNKDKDYTDALRVWVEACSKDCDFLPYNTCTGLCTSSKFYLSGYIVGKGVNKGKIEKSYALVFSGIMESRFGTLPDRQEVCDFRFVIHFENSKKHSETFVGAYQDIYTDSINEPQYYNGKHTISLECYEDIEELEKYKMLILSGKKLGCKVSFDVFPKKIKMDGNKINEKHLENIGKLTDYSIFEIEN